VALALGFLTDHGMEIAHQHWEGVGPRHRTKDVVWAGLFDHSGGACLDDGAGGEVGGRPAESAEL
jgi:hypothetical protein